MNEDLVNHPTHYASVVPGIECIDITRHYSFLRGNAIKYCWRRELKGVPIRDLQKADWYIACEIASGTCLPPCIEHSVLLDHLLNQCEDHFSGNVGQALHHLWRAGQVDTVEHDLITAAWYIGREIANLTELEG